MEQLFSSAYNNIYEKAYNYYTGDFTSFIVYTFLKGNLVKNDACITFKLNKLFLSINPQETFDL